MTKKKKNIILHEDLDVLTYWISLRGPVESVVGRASRVVDQIPAHGVYGTQSLRDFGYGLRRQIPSFLLPGARIVVELGLRFSGRGGSHLELGRQFGPPARRLDVPAAFRVRHRDVTGFAGGVALAVVAAGKVKRFRRGMPGRTAALVLV